MSLSTRQKKYLHLMGIPIYSDRAADEITEVESVQSEDYKASSVVEAAQTVSQSQITQSQVTLANSVNQEQESSEPKPVQDVLNKVMPTESTTVAEVSVHEVLKRSELPEDWSELIDHVANCKRCSLHESRTQTVFGTGNIQADWMIIGDSPGSEEDKAGLPFLGKHGDLLNTILESIGLAREQVYISNSVKCKPPANRDSKKSELAHCRAYLEQQIALVDPKVIICVGRIASQNLLQSEEPISRLRGKQHTIQHPIKIEKDIPVIVTYHPAYLLRSPSQKRKVWDDLKLAFSVLSE